MYYLMRFCHQAGKRAKELLHKAQNQNSTFIHSSPFINLYQYRRRLGLDPVMGPHSAPITTPKLVRGGEGGEKLELERGNG